MLNPQSVDALAAWLRSLTVRQIRLVEDLHPVTVQSSGRRLRGVQLAEGLWLARDRQLYLRAGMDTVIPVSHAQVVQLYHVGIIRQAWDRAISVARDRRRGCPV